jgi:uncharacterized protein (DUF1800 family)
MKSPEVSGLRLSMATVLLMLFSLIVVMPFAAQQPQPQPVKPVSPVAPIKPVLPDGSISSGEKLIPLPGSSAVKQGNRTRRSASALVQLNEDQKIIHLLNRAGFGPRPGDIDRVRRIGIESYLEEQLHPEDQVDTFLNKPLLALNTLQMSVPETIQTFAPPPPPPPPPAPTPPAPSAPTASKTLPIPALTQSMQKDDQPREAMAGQEMNRPQQQQPLAPQPQPGQANPVNQSPQPRPTMPPRDPQTPLRELQQAKLLRSVFSEKQLQEVMVDFWMNHFNIFAGKDNVRWMITSYERDVIRPRAMGRFRDLLLGVAQSPAMLYYLDNFLSQAEPRTPPQPAAPRPADAANQVNPENAQASQALPQSPPPPQPPPRRPGLNENYARELMELHTLGVDGGYSQQDVQEVARCFTGWTITPQPNTAFVFRPRVHDKGEKTILGRRISEGGGIEDGLRVIDILSRHPSTARFISYKLCQRFVADEPPAALVTKVIEKFEQTDGDIREMLRTILTSQEFYSPKFYRNKIKSPLELVASALRASGASTDGAAPVFQWIGRMGEALYLCQPPTGYSEESSRWLSNATLLERMNFALALMGNRINGTRVDPGKLTSLESELKDEMLLDQLIASLLHSDVSTETRDKLLSVMRESRAGMARAKYDDRAMRKNNEQIVAAISSLIFGSREFQTK